jgi:hypothetical protein
MLLFFPGLKAMKPLILQARLLLLFFVIALFLSGVTAIPLTWETNLLDRLATSKWLPLESQFPDLVTWIGRVNSGLTETFQKYTFLAYGTDWLAFGHIVIAIAFLGAFKDPLKNLWVVEFGMIACILLIPWALLFGAMRGIPLFWRFIDCSFGVVGIAPLWICRKLIRQAIKLNPSGGSTQKL